MVGNGLKGVKRGRGWSVEVWNREVREDKNELTVGDPESAPGRGNSKCKGPEMVMSGCV